MPYRRRYAKKKRNIRKRNNKKKYTRRKRYPLVSKFSPSGVPTARVSSLRYSEVIALTSTTGTLSSYVFRANSAYDPNYSSTGHQPMGYDTWSTLYNHYVVLGSKIRISVCPEGSSDVATVAVGCLLTDGTSAPYSDTTTYIEARKGQYRIRQYGQENPTVLYNKFSARKFFNVQDVKDNISRLGALNTANPSEDANFIIWLQAYAGASYTSRITVTIDYIVQWSEPKDLPQS